MYTVTVVESLSAFQVAISFFPGTKVVFET